MEQYRPLLEAVEEANRISKQTQQEYERAKEAYNKALQRNGDAYEKRREAVQALEAAMYQDTESVTATKAETIHEGLKTA